MFRKVKTVLWVSFKAEGDGYADSMQKFNKYQNEEAFFDWIEQTKKEIKRDHGFKNLVMLNCGRIS